MPTHEERLEAVEFNLRQFKTETIKAYGDMAYEMVIVKGLGEDSIKRLSALSSITEKRFDATNERLDTIEQRLDQIETKLTEHTRRFDTIETMLAQVLTRLPKTP